MPRRNPSDFELPSGLKSFPGLKAGDVTHPLDRDALNLLKQVPILDQVVNWMSKEWYERRLYLLFVSSSVRVNARMLPKLYEKFRWAMKILDLEDELHRQGRPEPELYITHSPIPNALTAGTDQTFIVLHSSIIDGFDERDWLYLIGHELGHIKAGHVLYLTLAAVILMVVDMIKVPGRELLLIPLLEWLRKAELTADRAAALCVQDETMCQSFHMKLAGGTRSLFDDMNLEEFIRQVDLYTQRNDIRDVFHKVFLNVWRTHPFPIFRAMELRQWMQGLEYERLLKRGQPAGQTSAARS